MIDGAELRRLLEHIDTVLRNAQQTAHAGPMSQDRLEEITRNGVLALVNGRPPDEQFKILYAATDRLLGEVLRLRERMSSQQRTN
jgi:hypothetical protein